MTVASPGLKDSLVRHATGMPLRHQIVQLEDQFYDLYNELNTVDDFDIHCIEEARTGTRFIKRSCRAVYQEQALAEEAQGAFKVFQRMHPAAVATAAAARRTDRQIHSSVEAELGRQSAARRRQSQVRLLKESCVNHLAAGSGLPQLKFLSSSMLPLP